MTGQQAPALEDKIMRLEADLKALRAETSVYRGALIWLMGVHQLNYEDDKPRRAVLDSLGLTTDYGSIDPSSPTDPQLAMVSRAFIEAAFSVFVSRQTPNT